MPPINMNNGNMEQVTKSAIKIEPPEFVVVNEKANFLSNSVKDNICIKDEPIEFQQPIFINEESFDEHTETDDVNEPGSRICGRIIVQTIGNGLTIYRLKCIYCKRKFPTTTTEFWNQFVSHLNDNHGTNHPKPTRDKSENLKIDTITEEPLKLSKDKTKIIPGETVLTNIKQNTNDFNTDSEDNNSSDFESYEPETKTIKKAATLGIGCTTEPDLKSKKLNKRIVSFDHPNKDCVITFLELLKIHPILWYPRRSTKKLSDVALATVSIDFNKRFPNYALTKDEVRQSVDRIKDLYSRGSKCKLKRQVKSHSYKIKHPEFFKLCSAVEESSKKIEQKCNLCKAVFYSSIDLQIHKVKIHAMGELPYKCQRCDYGFACPQKLASHEEKHNRVKSFPCELCNQSFYFENKLQAHMVLHTDDNKVICEICGKNFPKKQYRRHMLRHEKPKEKCHTCGKSFFEKWELSEHMKIHCNERHYKCNICNKSFNRQRDVTIHKRGVHKIKFQEYVWDDRIEKSSNYKTDAQLYDIEENSDTHNSNSNSSSYSTAPNKQNVVEVKSQISNNQNHQMLPLEMLDSLMN